MTCGTDLKVFKRGYHAKMIVPPAVFGHEMAGVVIEVSPEAAGWQVGDPVVVANSAQTCHAGLELGLALWLEIMSPLIATRLRKRQRGSVSSGGSVHREIQLASSDPGSKNSAGP